MADELFSYGSITSQALHLSDAVQADDLVGGDGIVVQPLFLDIIGVPLVDLPPLCPRIADSFELVPKITASGRDDHLPSLNSLALRPQLTGADRGPRPSIKSGEKLVPKIKDSKGTCN